MYRPDRVSILYPVNTSEIKVANPLGGGIYIEVPYESDEGIVDIQIQNAVPSPIYSALSYHQTSLEEWQNIERNLKAPWADFQTEKFMIYVPTDWIYKMENPGPVLAEWDKAMDGTNELMGYDHRRGKETLFAQVDLDLPYGFHATGYPGLNAWYDPYKDYGGDYDHYLLTGPRDANYVELHEMGHGYLFPKLESDIESTVNLLHVAALNNKLGVSLDEAFNLSAPGGNAYRTVDHAAIAWMMLPNFKDKKPMTGTEKMYQHKGHANYTELARLFGWDVLHNYWREYMIDDEKGIVSKAIDGANKDTILFRLSKAVGGDITPLFQFWGVYANDPGALAIKITANKLMPSMKIYETLKKYQSLIPADKKSFHSFATHWWGGEEELAKAKYLASWDTYDEIYAAMVYSNVQDIIEHYFPEGPPEVVGASDTEAPGPNPMSFSINPGANGEQSILMMASAASDSTWVEYCFTNTSGNGHNSEWQSSRLYVDKGLSANTQYTYTVKARDYSPAKNMTAPSKPVSATTDIKDTSPPEPDSMSMRLAPIANSPSTIYMEAKIAADVSGVEYNFVCTTEGGHHSGWQDDPTYTDIGLTPNTSYSYTVTARDKSPQCNGTKVSSELSATTLEAVTEPYLVMSKPVYAVGEEIVVHYVDPSRKKWAWIGIYSPPSDVSHSPGDGIQYQYVSENPTGGEKSGTINFTGMVKGKYQARIHYGEGYQIFARIEFSIE
jgi:chitodextrinase